MKTGLEIGKVVGSNDQADYLVQVHGPGDVPIAPAPAEHAFGQFVEIPVDDANRLVGIIYTTQLFNPSYGALGPRLSTEQELPVFSPDYLAETATIVGVAIVGTARVGFGAVEFSQLTPGLAAALGAPVRQLPDDAVSAFHQPGGRLQLAYVARLLARPFPALPDLLCGILDRLGTAWPAERDRLAVVRQNIRWHAAVERR
jgi:hypothetical protein